MIISDLLDQILCDVIDINDLELDRLGMEFMDRDYLMEEILEDSVLNGIFKSKSKSKPTK